MYYHWILWLVEIDGIPGETVCLENSEICLVCPNRTACGINLQDCLI